MSEHEVTGGHRRAKLGIGAVAYLLIGVAILVVVNLISYKLPTKLGSFQTDLESIIGQFEEAAA